MKISKPWWVSTVVFLSILLIVSIVLGVTGYFFSVPMSKTNISLVVGDSAEIGVISNETSVFSLQLDGDYLPGEKLPYSLQIKALDLDKNVFVRLKSVVFGGKEPFNVNFSTDDKFTFENDGYYYYDGTIAGGDKVLFSEEIVLPENIVLTSGNKYILSVVVECVDENVDINQIWKG